MPTSARNGPMFGACSAPLSKASSSSLLPSWAGTMISWSVSIVTSLLVSVASCRLSVDERRRYFSTPRRQDAKVSIVVNHKKHEEHEGIMGLNHRDHRVLRDHRGYSGLPFTFP